MRSRRPSPEHQEAVSRRLALLSEQLASARDEAPAVGDEWWGEHTRVAPLRPALHVVTPAGKQPDPWDVPAPAADTLLGRQHDALEGAVPAAPSPGRAPGPVLVPVPGRHADRRRLTWSVVLPETLRGRVALGPGPVAVVAVLVAVALGWTCWQVVRDDPEPSTPATAAAPAGDLVPVGAAPTSAPSAAPASPSAAGAPGAPAGTVTVDVAGRVRRPGIVVLDAGSRVVDALRKAGGARGSVDLTTLNLARPLVDGEQILVGVEGAAAAPPPPAAGVGGGSSSGPTGPPAPAGLVDLNLADQTQLEALPEIGPVTAAAIVRWREEHGGFSAVTELLEVDGIGDATLATLTPLVTV